MLGPNSYGGSLISYGDQRMKCPRGGSLSFTLGGGGGGGGASVSGSVQSD